MNFTTGLRLISTLAMLGYTVAVAPASALATDRYVGVGGSTTDPTCTDPAHPCDLEHVVSTVADAGDDVTVEPGTYNVPQVVSVDRAMTIHGKPGAPRPTLSAGGFYDSPLAGTPALRYLDLELSGGNMFFGHGVAEQLIVVAADGPCSLSGTLVFRDNVCVATGAGSAAVDVETNGATESVALRNDTALATASNGVAIRAATQAAGGAVTVDVFNTIAQGGGGPTGADIQANTLGKGTVTVNTNHSEYTKAIPSGPGAAINTSVTDQHALPVFVPGTYHEAPASASTIGKGAVDPSNGPFDLDGDLRAIAGSTDIGADQYVTPPSVTAVGGSGHDGHGAVTATINTHGSPTTYLVHYGPTPSYGSTSASLSLPPADAPATVSIPMTGLTPGGTYHVAVSATNGAGTATSSDASFTDTVTPPPPPPPPPPTGSTPGGGTGQPAAPQDSRLAFTHASFAVHRTRTTRRAHRRRLPVGTTITYTDSQAATTTLIVERRVSGIVRGRRCILGRSRSAQGRRCTRYLTVGSLRHRDRSGRNRIVFTGRLGRRVLSPGRYRMSAVPVNVRGLRGRPCRHAFTVVSASGS